jgi:hypothetical protein
MSVEASGTQSWKKYAHATFGIEEFGLSAPAPKVQFEILKHLFLIYIYIYIILFKYYLFKIKY